MLISELVDIPETRKAVAPIDNAEVSKVLAQYLADIVRKDLDNVLDNEWDNFIALSISWIQSV